MITNYNEFYDGDYGNKRLKKEFIFSYTFVPGLYDTLCRVNLFVKSNMSYQLYLFFYDTQIEEEFMETPEVARIKHYQESKLPYIVRTKLSRILKQNFVLKNSYFNSNNVFGILDRTEVSCKINHKNDQFSINLSPDILDKSKFKTKSEKDFLEMIEIMEKWLKELKGNTMKLYEVDDD
ncbi:hypothetical protein [Kordia jejudonensis]|uniref:hypothetical protein n=1 Tax=Kordia jejudonensis TaxID=1348245 RepID=UPI0006298731|nr:hypothetical protein [Kordia jejudonensis]